MVQLTLASRRLQGDHLASWMLLSINEPPLGEFPYDRALHIFFKKLREKKNEVLSAGQ